MLVGGLPKIGVLWGVLARVPMEVSMKDLREHSLEHPDFGEHPPRAFSGAILGFSRFRPVSQARKFPVQEIQRPLMTKSGKRPIKVGKRPIKEGKRPIKAMVLVGMSVGCLMRCFRAPPRHGGKRPL